MMITTVMLLHAVLVLASAASSSGAILVNEVAYKGNGLSTCDGKDWVELLNNGEAAVDLGKFTLHDDKGPSDEHAKTFAAGEVVIAAGAVKVLCRKLDFHFAIGGSDTVTLLDASSEVVSTSGALPGTGGHDTQTYALFEGGNFKYTTTPTPGAVNVFTAPEQNAEAQLTEQNALGLDFFRLNDDGTTRDSSPFQEVVDFFVELDDANKNYLETKPSHQEYVPVDKFTVVSGSGKSKTTTVLSAGGRIRTKGQSTVTYLVCLGLGNTPFRVDFDTKDATQRLFGMETAYLRNHFNDQSYMREYAIHRINARFGLPFLRSRMVRVFLNGDLVGLYTLLEAPDQAYVMQRSFGAFDASKTGLFKFKTMAAGCGRYSSSEISYAKSRPVPDPYYFERGDHRDQIPVLGFWGAKCSTFFKAQLGKDRRDVIKGYLENQSNCSLAMVELGLVDRHFGPKTLNSPVIDFLEKNIYNVASGATALAGAVDTDQWLKNFAVYAVTLNNDSPINNLNNWYIATMNGGENDWKVVQWDHNLALNKKGACSPNCGSSQVHWPITRPSCHKSKNHPLLGPLFAVPGNYDKYLQYVADFSELLTPALFAELRAHGDAIADDVYLDPLSSAASAAAYKEKETSAGTDGYDAEDAPFIKMLEVRAQQVALQVKAIEDQTIARTEYGGNEQCRDWRNGITKKKTTGDPTKAPTHSTDVAPRKWPSSVAPIAVTLLVCILSFIIVAYYARRCWCSHRERKEGYQKVDTSEEQVHLTSSLELQ